MDRLGRGGESVEQGSGRHRCRNKIWSQRARSAGWEWEMWRNQLSRRHRDMDTLRGSRKWDCRKWGGGRCLPSSVGQQNGFSELSWQVLLEPAAGNLLGHNWPFAFSYLQQDPSVSPLHSQSSELCLALSCVSQRVNWPLLQPCLPWGVVWSRSSLRHSPGAADAQEGGSSFLCGFGGDGGLASWWRHQWDAEEDVTPLAAISPFWKALWNGTKIAKILFCFALPCCILKTLKFCQSPFFWEFLIVWHPCCIKVTGTNFYNVNDNHNFSIIKVQWAFSYVFIIMEVVKYLRKLYCIRFAGCMFTLYL